MYLRMQNFVSTQHTPCVYLTTDSKMSLISVTHMQMSLSLHLNAHYINFCIVIYGCAYRETAMLNLIASPEMFETYFCTWGDRGGPGTENWERSHALPAGRDAPMIEMREQIGRCVAACYACMDIHSVGALVRWAHSEGRPNPEGEGLKGLSLYWIIYIQGAIDI